MTTQLEDSRPQPLPGRLTHRLRNGLLPFVLRHRIVAAAVIASLISAFYWLVLASDRYVSESHVIIQRTDLTGGQAMDFSNLLAGVSNGNRADQLLLRDHLLSVDILRKLDATLDLRGHYSDRNRDFLSRLWFRDASTEWFHRHFLARTVIEYDDYTGALVVKAQAYDPKMAQMIVTLLVREGEAFMNAMAHSLAQAQVDFLENQVVQMNTRAIQARQALVEYQNSRGMVSPKAAAENLVNIIDRLEGQRTELETQRSALQAYLVADHPNIVKINQQIAAVERQLAQEKAKLAAPTGKTLNRTVEEYQRLETEAAFAVDVYKTALTALERGRIEATRTIKKVSVLQSANLPEYPLEPRRFYNSLVFALAAMLLAGIAHLLAAIIRDHQD